MRFPRFVPVLVCMTLNTFSLFAQSPNGNINGLVSDPSSAAVVGAEMVAVNDVTGVQYTTKTNSEGIYVLPNLPPGPYRVQVSKIGFKTIIKPDIVLNVQDSLSINFTLLVGAFHDRRRNSSTSCGRGFRSRKWSAATWRNCAKPAASRRARAVAVQQGEDAVLLRQ